MKKILELEVELSGNGVCKEQVFDTDDDNKLLFSVSNLDECPEDAIISRDLFNAGQYLSAIRYGIELAKQGYDAVEYVSVKR
jgi:hypothetical protein